MVEYFIKLLIAVLVGYLLTEMYHRYKRKKPISVVIIGRGGTRRVVKIVRGDVPEFDELISFIKKKRGKSGLVG
ncbi:MAG: hypothetical protein JKY50_07250 [Oleispira sp.]|nr:hypothetical protein [Oleispira sp.]MBL4881203.1 hypothetical protein [Oleispira sp.]